MDFPCPDYAGYEDTFLIELIKEDEKEKKEKEKDGEENERR